ncbi:MAG: hypothetical protein RLZZ156_958 [Deinococcota bacterium]
MHRAALIELLEKVPTEQADFKAWENGMSFTKIADHLSGSSIRMGKMMQGVKPDPIEPSADFVSSIERLKTTLTDTQAMLGAMSDEAFQVVVPAFGGREMPVSALVDFMIQHEAHHKGQVWLMARMVGIEPHMFIKMG